MKPHERQKMCTYCDGRIPLDAQHCPYCATEQIGSGHVYLQHKSIQDSLSLPPLYAAKNPGIAKDPSTPSTSTFKEPMSEKKFQHTTPLSGANIHLDAAEPSQDGAEKNSFWPIFFLSLGAQLLILGLLQLFFSEKGMLTLQWTSHYWFVYCLVALPLCYMGLKKINVS